MNLEQALAELDRHSVELIEHPKWVTITSEQISAAQYLLSDEFLNSSSPFDTPKYKQIGFPFNLGKIQDTSAVIESTAYRLALGPRDFWYIRGCDLPEDFEYLRGVCEQYDVAAQTIYGPHKYLWHFQIDIRNVFPGRVHRSTLGIDFLGGKEPFHVENNLDYAISRMLKEICEGGYFLRNARNEPFRIGSREIKFLGIPLTFNSIFSDPVNEDCFTEFKNLPFKFGNWDILHFIAEPHRSPIMPIRAKRVFMQGVARPI